MKKKKSTKKLMDPFAKREAQKYDQPIPSREYILMHLRDLGQPATFAQLVKVFNLNEKDEQKALTFRLKAMLRDCQLMTDRRDRFCLIDKLTLIAGKVTGHPDGYGFVIPDDGSDDLFLSAQQMRSVLHGDRVFVREVGKDRRGRRLAKVHEVIEHKYRRIVGRLFIEHEMCFVQPDNRRITHDILIPSNRCAGAEHGQVVLLEITAPPTKHSQPIGEVKEVLGDPLSPGLEIDIAIRSYELPYQWSPELTQSMKKLPKKVTIKDIEGRADLRQLPFVTIDGEDAQDFDDAVYCESRPKGGWCLYVAIADVSHYVQSNTPLDQEALSRGTSVYFPGRVIPMLPEALSNGLCSLKPKVDRLSMVCELQVSPQGKLTRSRFYPAVIHSHARLTYREVAGMLLDSDRGLCEKYKTLLPHLQCLYALYQALHQARLQRGAIDFEMTETRIVFDNNRKIKQILPVVRNDAHRLIEECMVLANIAAARFLQKHRIPALFRDHDEPTTEKVAGLSRFLAELSLSLPGGKKPQAKNYAQLLTAAMDRPDKKIIQTVMLRSLAQAKYMATNTGHFGLALPMYTHFTSPIRRYPDLLVHRAIRHILTHETVDEYRYDTTAMEQLGKHCSETERRADEATWDVIAWLKCEYMQTKLGMEFDGVVAGVTSFGLFVELKAIYVEGLVHITSLKRDYYQFDSSGQRLIGERTKQIYRLGDALRVQVVRVNLHERKIDFDLVSESDA